MRAIKCISLFPEKPQYYKADVVTALGHRHTSVFDQLAYSTREDEFIAIWDSADPALNKYLDRFDRSLWTKIWGHPAKKTRPASTASVYLRLTRQL